MQLTLVEQLPEECTEPAKVGQKRKKKFLGGVEWKSRGGGGWI